MCSSHDREETTYSSRERWWVIIVKRINTVYFILLKYFTINFFVNSRLFFLPFVVGSSMTSDALCEALGIHVEVTVAITLTEAGAASI